MSPRILSRSLQQQAQTLKKTPASPGERGGLHQKALHNNIISQLQSEMKMAISLIPWYMRTFPWVQREHPLAQNHQCKSRCFPPTGKPASSKTSHPSTTRAACGNPLFPGKQHTDPWRSALLQAALLPATNLKAHLSLKK